MSSEEFDYLLTTNTECLKPYALVLTHDTESAKDLMQETLYKALANKEKFHVGTNIKAWLFTILRNIFINDYRKKVRLQSVFYAKNDVQVQYYPTTNNGELTGEKEIIIAIQSLPLNFKQPFQLYFDGYKYEEIASILNEPLGTIKSRIHFARKILKNRVL